MEGRNEMRDVGQKDVRLDDCKKKYENAGKERKINNVKQEVEK